MQPLAPGFLHSLLVFLTRSRLLSLIPGFPLAPLGLWVWGPMAACCFGSPDRTASPPMPQFPQVIQ